MRGGAFIVICLAAMLCGASRPLDAAETNEQRFIISVERIWDRAGHSAFTDIVEHQGAMYCAFREGSGHIPGLNGVVRILRSTDGANWEALPALDEPGVDLRDPKLSITPDGRIMVSMGASYYEGSERKKIESRVAFSEPDLRKFTPPQRVMFPSQILTGADWLWRVTWHGDTAWGCVQQVPDKNRRSLRLVKSPDGIHYEEVLKLPVEGANETTLRFLPDETLLAMIRCESPDPKWGQIGLAKPPYTEWKITPANKRFGGPNLVQVPSGAWLAGSRGYEGKSSTTELWSLNIERAEFTHLVTLPSGGDTSYPGFVLDEPGGQLWMSYYSSHEGKGAIYLARLRLAALIAATK